MNDVVLDDDVLLSEVVVNVLDVLLERLVEVVADFDVVSEVELVLVAEVGVRLVEVSLVVEQLCDVVSDEDVAVLLVEVCDSLVEVKDSEKVVSLEVVCVSLELV